MTLAKDLFPDPGFMLGVLDALLASGALSDSDIEQSLSGVADDNFGSDSDEHHDDFQIEEARAREAIRRLGELELNSERVLTIDRLHFDGGDRIYEALENACDICTGGEADYYEVHDLEGLSELPNLCLLNLVGYGYQPKGLCLEPLRGHAHLETLVLTSKCTSMDVLTTLPKLASVDFAKARLAEAELSEAQKVIETLRARNVEIQREPILWPPKAPAKSAPAPAAPTPTPAPVVDEKAKAPAPDLRVTRRTGASWETKAGKKTSYIDVRATEIVVGSHWGTGHTDNAGICSREAFSQGQFHDLIRADHGEEVLQEVLDLVGS